jgi:hypothetical protein
MADKEIIHTSSGDGGAGIGMIVGLLLAAVIVVGGLFVFFNGGFDRTASGPSVTIKAPSTTGSGGGTSK